MHCYSFQVHIFLCTLLLSLLKMKPYMPNFYGPTLPNHPCQNFHTCHFLDPCQNFMDPSYPCHPCQNLTHATHTTPITQQTLLKSIQATFKFLFPLVADNCPIDQKLVFCSSKSASTIFLLIRQKTLFIQMAIKFFRNDPS